MGKMLKDGKNVQSLAVIVLDVFLYNFWRRDDINKLFFSSEKWVVACHTVKFLYTLDDFKGNNWPLKSSKMYENLTVGWATTHFSLKKTICWYHSSFKSYRGKRDCTFFPSSSHILCRLINNVLCCLVIWMHNVPERWLCIYQGSNSASFKI